MLGLHEMVRAVELVYNFGAETAGEIEYATRQTMYSRIRRLEELTQIKFFDRTYRYGELTQSGREWLEQYNSIYGG